MFDRPIRLLLVEDSPGDARLFTEMIKEARAFQFELVHRDSLDRALAFLAEQRPDMIVLDLGLPDGGGLEAIHRVQRAAAAVPLVVLTGLDDEAAAIQALHAGAQDYLIKGQMSTSLLVRALRYAFERHGMQMALRKESTIDELTGLANRRGFLMLAEQHAMLARRTGERFVVAFIDLAEYARERRIAVRTEEIDQRLQAQFIGLEGQAAFQARVEEAGATIADVRHLIGQQILRDRVVHAVAEEQLSDERLLEEYQSRLPELTTVELSHILLNDGDLATELAGRVTPQNFPRLARRHSKDPSTAPAGGDLGLRQASDLVTAVARAAVRAEIGAIVGPVESEFGFHLIWVRGRDAPPFETVRPDLVEELQGQVFVEWLLDRLREAEIRVNPSYGVFDPDTGEVVARRSASPGEQVQLTP